MKTITDLHLARSSDDDLGWLFHHFNAALAQTKPFSRAWREATCGAEAVLRERMRRAHRAAPRPF